MLGRKIWLSANAPQNLSNFVINFKINKLQIKSYEKPEMHPVISINRCYLVCLIFSKFKEYEQNYI